MIDANPVWGPTSPITHQPVITEAVTGLRRYVPILAIVVFSVLAAGVTTYFNLLNSDRSVGQVAAASSNGTATLELQPTAQTFRAGQSVSIAVVMNPSLVSVDGVQISANLAGTIPSDLHFVPAVPASLELVSNQVVSGGTQPNWRMAMVTQDPATGYSTQNQAVTIGQIQFTAPTAGSFQIAFDPTLTRVVQHSIAQDILRIPSIGQYVFETPSITPSPTAQPPQPTIVATAVPTATPLPTPTPVVLPTPSPTVTMVVEQARWREWPYRWNQLSVRVSGVPANAKVEVVGFGALSYNRRTQKYSRTFYTNQKPTQITITTSTGQTVTVPVEIIKWK